MNTEEKQSRIHAEQQKILDKYGLIGNHSIRMTVRDDGEFLSPYSETDTPVISSEVADFLDNSALAFHQSEGLTLDIYSDCIDEEEQKVYSRAIRNYYALRQVACERDLRRNTVVALIMTIVGVIALAFMAVLSHHGVKDIWVECVDIFAWVFLWEAVDQYFIERRGAKLRQKRNAAFMEMKVRFHSLGSRQ